MTHTYLPSDYKLPFGKYAGEPLASLLADARYCRWLLRQDFVKSHHPALHARVSAHLTELARLRSEFARAGKR